MSLAPARHPTDILAKSVRQRRSERRARRGRATNRLQGAARRFLARNREAYAAAATEAAVKAGARPTISTATLFRHQYPNTLGRYKAYQEQKEWK